MTGRITINLEAKIRAGRVPRADLDRIESIIHEVKQDLIMEKLPYQPAAAIPTEQEIKVVSELRARKYSAEVIATLTGISRPRLRNILWAIYRQRSLRLMS